MRLWLPIVVLAACSPLDDFELPTGDGDKGACAGDSRCGDPSPPCQSVDCFEPGPVAGCSDGEREGFTSNAAYPFIAACSGGWSVPGVTRADLVPVCERGAGDDSLNPDGQDCSAADLCAQGWRICRGAHEVELRSPTGCAGAVPAGTPDRALLFVVDQPSSGAIECGTSGDDDLFGCGNLGFELEATSNCGPLERALASAVAGSCGYNEAEPPIGPWECTGGVDSEQHEGAIVTKAGCPAQSCEFSGSPVGNADRGGVLCCRVPREGWQ